MSTNIIGLVLFLIVYSTYLPVVFGDEIDMGGEPSHSLSIQTSNTQLDPGDSFKIELSVAGLGNVDISNVLVSIPEQISKYKKVNFTQIEFVLNNTGLYSMPNVTYEPPRFWFLIPNIIYELAAINQTSSTEMYSGASPLSFGQARYGHNQSYAPYTIDFVVADDAPPGDYEIPIAYNYKNSGKWYLDKEIVKLHINRFYETDKFRKVASALTFLSFLFLIMQIIKGSFEAWRSLENFGKP